MKENTIKEKEGDEKKAFVFISAFLWLCAVPAPFVEKKLN
jgi:hypothetical protein